MSERGTQKKNGADAAKKWLATADPAEIVRLAGYDFDYQLDCLSDLAAQGFSVPPSRDHDFSWGFFKKVKGHAVHKVWKN